jgi:hypothetical protein
MRFNDTVSHVPGKALNTADTLSRLPNLKPEKKTDDLPPERGRSVYYSLWTTFLLLRRRWELEIALEQDNESDPICKQVKKYTVRQIGQTKPAERDQSQLSQR